jgi:hypothetical protein
MPNLIHSGAPSSLGRVPLFLTVAVSFLGATPRPAVAEGSKTLLQILNATIKDKVIEGAFERAKQNKPCPPYDEGIARMKAKLQTSS